MAFVPDTSKPVYGTWTFGYLDGYQAWMQQNYVANDPDVLAYIAAMSPQPSSAQKARINALITGLKEDGLWVLLDYLMLFSKQEAQQNALINAKNPAQVATVVGAMSFSPANGFTGNGTSSYLTTTFNPFPGDKLFKQNDAHMGVWCNNDVQSSTQADLGTNVSAICARNATGWQARCNNVAGFTAPLSPATSQGHSLWTRSAANAHVNYKNAGGVSTGALASAALVNFPFAICARNNAGVFDQFSARSLGIVHWGKNLTPLQAVRMFDRLNTYMTASYF